MRSNLTRKWDLSHARVSEPWPRRLVRVGWWPLSGGWGIRWAGVGAAAQGDVEAEVFESGDVVVHLVAGAGAAVVIVCAEVLVAQAGVG
jgi:hypothetical protein